MGYFPRQDVLIGTWLSLNLFLKDLYCISLHFILRAPEGDNSRETLSLQCQRIGHLSVLLQVHRWLVIFGVQVKLK